MVKETQFKIIKQCRVYSSPIYLFFIESLMFPPLDKESDKGNTNSRQLNLPRKGVILRYKQIALQSSIEQSILYI